MRPFLARACLFLLFFPQAALAADWVRVETPHLIVFGPGEKRAREVAAEFERFREAVSQILPAASTVSAVPTIIIAFENDAAFNRYRPTFNGKPVRVGGFYTGSDSDDMIAFPYDGRENSRQIIFHEYTHLITSNAARGLPLWVSEGLADFYSTFEIRPDGKQAVLGHVVPRHVELLNSQTRWLSLEDLLSVTHESPLYNEGQRRSVFYAQSWGMVHLLMTGEPRRTQELAHYVQLTNGGMAHADAWKRAFGDFDVERELRRYFSRFTVRGFLFKFAEGVAVAKAEARTPPKPEVEAVLSRLRRYRNADQVEQQLAKAAAQTPASAVAKALLGHTLARGTRHEEGLKLLVEAAGDSSDWLVQYYVASGVASQGRPARELAEVGRAAADRVIASRPQMAHGYALKARLGEGADAVAHIRKARALAPGREDYAFIEARLHADLRDFPTARKTLAPLLTPNYQPRVREFARSLMGQIVQMEEYFKKRDSAPPPPSPTTPSPTTPGANPPVPTGVRWIFRELKPGEQRTEGTLVAIECSQRTGVTLVVRADGAVKRFIAREFGHIEFITYREQQGGSISCGERKPPDAVYVTWLPLEKSITGIAGRPVAVEFLPDKR
jgi:hypothetical protein